MRSYQSSLLNAYINLELAHRSSIFPARRRPADARDPAAGRRPPERGGRAAGRIQGAAHDHLFTTVRRKSFLERSSSDQARRRWRRPEEDGPAYLARLHLFCLITFLSIPPSRLALRAASRALGRRRRGNRRRLRGRHDGPRRQGGAGGARRLPGQGVRQADADGSGGGRIK